VQSLFYTKDTDHGKRYMGAEGGFREWLEAGKLADSEPWFSSKVYLFHIKVHLCFDVNDH